MNGNPESRNEVSLSCSTNWLRAKVIIAGARLRTGLAVQTIRYHLTQLVQCGEVEVRAGFYRLKQSA